MKPILVVEIGVGDAIGFVRARTVDERKVRLMGQMDIEIPILVDPGVFTRRIHALQAESRNS